MGFFKNLFSRKSEEREISEWDRVQGEKDSLNMNDPGVRERYVLSCLEQMQEASMELELAEGEYDLVTSYLTDMEEIDNLKGPKKEELESIARHIHDLRKDHDEYVLTPSLISEEDYRRMEAMSDDIDEALDKLSAEEEMRDKIKADLKRLDRERNSYRIRKNELTNTIANEKGLVQIVMITGVIAILILFGAGLLRLDVPQLIYYIVLVALAVSVTVIYVKYVDAVAEKRKVENTINELILLENKVKIRYVNNKNLLDYLCIKYNVESADALRKLYSNYVSEKEKRRKYERNEAIFEDEMIRLMRVLRTIDVRNPEVWKHQTDAIYDSREMVEVRHGLIGRRQKLRKRMEYNGQIALEASEEIKGIVQDYPQYADSIMAIVDAFDKK